MRVCVKTQQINIKYLYCIVHKFYFKIKPKQILNSNDMHAEILQRKCTDICNFFKMVSEKESIAIKGWLNICGKAITIKC